jgi:hypothetical protein
MIYLAAGITFNSALFWVLFGLAVAAAGTFMLRVLRVRGELPKEDPGSEAAGFRTRPRN